MAAAVMNTTCPAVHGNVKLPDLRAAIDRPPALQGACIYTVRLMTRLGLLAQAVAHFRVNDEASPASGEVGRQFVAQMSRHADPLVASMAQFEAVLRKVRDGSAGRYGIEWDRNPNDVFKALEQGAELPSSEGMPCYFVEIAAELPGMVCCTRFAEPATAPQSPDLQSAIA
jgi:hypothetical protein